jgi:hypothetical protein
MRWMVHIAHIVDIRNAYNILIRKPGRKIPLERPSHRKEDKIKMDLKETEHECVDCIHLAQDRYWWQAHMKM